MAERPELRSGSVEFAAPSEFTNRPQHYEARASLTALFLVAPHDGFFSKDALRQISQLGTFLRFERFHFAQEMGECETLPF